MSHSYIHAYRNVHTDRYSKRDVYAHGYCHIHAYGDRYRYVDIYADAYGYAYVNADADRYVRAEQSDLRTMKTFLIGIVLFPILFISLIIITWYLGMLP